MSFKTWDDTSQEQMRRISPHTDEMYSAVSWRRIVQMMSCTSYLTLTLCRLSLRWIKTLLDWSQNHMRLLRDESVETSYVAQTPIVWIVTYMTSKNSLIYETLCDCHFSRWATNFTRRPVRFADGNQQLHVTWDWILQLTKQTVGAKDSTKTTPVFPGSWQTATSKYVRAKTESKRSTSLSTL